MEETTVGRGADEVDMEERIDFRVARKAEATEE